MKITKKQCSHEKIIKEGHVLYLDNNEYLDGDVIIGFIKDNYIEGRICITESNIYFLQNKEEGSRPVNFSQMLGFNRSWEFSVSGEKSFSSSVHLFNYKKELDFNINELKSKFPLPNFIVNGYGNFIRKGRSNSFFTITQFPHCCGSTILSNFRENRGSVFHQLSKEDIDEIDSILKRYMNSNKIAYLLKENESDAISFLIEKLNFKVIDEFKNKNTSRIIQVLSRNDHL